MRRPEAMADSARPALHLLYEMATGRECSCTISLVLQVNETITASIDLEEYGPALSWYEYFQGKETYPFRADAEQFDL